MPFPQDKRQKAMKELDDAEAKGGTTAANAKKLRAIVESEAFRKALDEFTDDPKAREAASKDAKGHLKRRGVDLPDEVTVEFKNNTWSIKLCWFDLCITFTWDG